MFIEMHNVGFGDCFNITNNNHHLIVDCGSVRYKGNRQHPKTFKDFVEHCIIQEINMNPTDDYSALITHFHQDHYRGFNHMSKAFNMKSVFSCLYVPYLLVKDSATNEHFLLDQLICSFLIYANSSNYYKLANDALNHIINLAPLSIDNNVQHLCYGRSFSVYNKRFDVLWPDPTYTYLSAINNESSYDIIEITGDALRTIQHSSSLENTTDSIFKIKKELIELFNKWYTSYNHNDFSKANRIELINRMKNPLDELLKIRQSIKMDDIWKFRQYSALGKSLIDSANSTSIVFQDRDGKLLMTGDITTNIIDRVLIYRFNIQLYKILKAPHHGTHSNDRPATQHYSSQHLPFSSNLLISSGYKTRYNPISQHYSTHRLSNKTSWCTAGKNHCDNLNNRCTCSNNSCRNDYVALFF
ncbi:hypothetical protein SAMN05216582_1408 [Selenomonas ruminantium]|uniref:Metallo-beta-lactamase domain-containing protein n=1 Tax=Selenomonas ruminantium TaxID=971 RepID=A0A1M6XP63_SELRU|nr:hypothetical protein [Selenomonas ruminantium]SHL07726.1 hypothetical protein SAMN05216582_1408 [Selenomonas ruminantium]